MLDGEFGSVVGVAADSRGRLYVGDGMQNHVDVYSPDGAYISRIGRRGRGPGEFMGLRSVALGRGDTLFVFDVQLQRVSLFSTLPEPALAEAVQVSRPGEVANYQVFPTEAGGVVVPYVTLATDANIEDQRNITFRYLHGNAYADSREVLRVPDREFLVTRDPRFGYAVGALPYGREPLYTLGPGDLFHYTWNEHLRLEQYDLTGRRQTATEFPFPSSPVTDADVKLLLDSFSSDPRSELARVPVERAHNEGRLPRTKPTVRSMLVDDQGMVWARLVTEEDVVVSTGAGLAFRSRSGGVSTWLVVEPTGEPAAVVELPHEVTLSTITGGAAYGITTDELGTQRVERFWIQK